jgi:hypothetical protein
MSLAMYAAPFDDDTNQINTNSQINKKRASINHNKTQKRYPKDNYTDKVNSVLQSIHNLPDNEGGELGDFQPIPPPTSAGVEQTRLRESEVQGTNYMQEKSMFASSPTTSQHALPGNIAMADIEMQKRYIPNYESMYKQTATPSPNNVPYYTNGVSSMYQNYMNSNGGETNDVLLEKLNYMIHLLEEQQDERTNNVTEEVILYCFLGIFIIFIVDSFVRVGKYVR